MNERQVTVLAAPVYRTTVLNGQGPAGPPGPSAASAFQPVIFGFGDATPAPIGTVPGTRRVVGVELAIDTPFDGIGAEISVGTAASPALLLGPGIDVSVAATYALAPQEVFTVDTPIFLFITPGSGASHGSGALFIQTQ